MHRRVFLVETLCALAFVFLGPSPSGAKTKQPSQISGIYTDLYYNEEGGDLLGTELFVVPTQSGWVVFYQHWEGGGDDPIVVPATVNGPKLTFRIPEAYLGGGRYEGRITSTGFKGIWHHSDSKGEPFYLQRKKSHWQ